MFFEFSEVKLCGENKSLANYLFIMEMSIDFDSDDDYSGNNIGFNFSKVTHNFCQLKSLNVENLKCCSPWLGDKMFSLDHLKRHFCTFLSC